MLSKAINALQIALGKDVVRFEEYNLPLFRNNDGLEDNQKYLSSAVDQINHVGEHVPLNHHTTFLDFGCGQGRIVNGMKRAGIEVGKYIGIDTQMRSISWCKKYLSGYGEQYEFIHVAAQNARYNPGVKGLSQLPVEQNSVNIIFLNSVFSHMLSDDVIFYLKEFNRILKPGGRVYMTAFVEENVPEEEENPENFVRESKGHLHHVRFEKGYFFDLIKSANLSVEAFYYRHFERSNQSVVVATMT